MIKNKKAVDTILHMLKSRKHQSLSAVESHGMYEIKNFKDRHKLDCGKRTLLVNDVEFHIDDDQITEFITIYESMKILEENDVYPT